MSKVIENGYFIRSYKQWGVKPKCGCVQFTFDNMNWFTSRLQLSLTGAVTFFALVLSCNLFQEMKLRWFLCVVLLILLVSIVSKLLFFVRKETLYVIAPVGVQFVTTYVIGQESVLFVPWHSVRNFVIVEMIVGQQIFFFLGLQNRTKNNDRLVILFQSTKPRLSYLEEIYRVTLEHCQT